MLAYSENKVMFGVAVAPIVVLILLALKRLVFSPLRKIPGPFWAKVSPLWLWVHDLQGTAPARIEELHQKHGEFCCSMLTSDTKS